MQLALQKLFVTNKLNLDHDALLCFVQKNIYYEHLLKN